MGRGKRPADSKVPMGPALMLLKGIHFYKQHFQPDPGIRGYKEKWESLRNLFRLPSCNLSLSPLS